MKTNSPRSTAGSSDEQILRGIKVSPGIAIGPAYIIDQLGVSAPEYSISADQVDSELKRFRSAVNKTQKQIVLLKQKAEALPAGAMEEIALLLDAYKGMLSGSRLVRGVEETVTRERINAEAALQKQLAAITASFAAMNDPYLASRINDIREVGSRLTRNLLQQQYNPFAEAPAGCVLIAEEITPADTALMDPDRIAGFAAVLGGIEGHAAIMARALGLPAVLGVAGVMHGVSNGTTIIVDGVNGELVLNPQPATLNRYRQEAARLARLERKLKALNNVPAITSDGVPVTLLANIELPREAARAMEAGAQGVGLLRTEFMFMNRPGLPSEDEQFEALSQITKHCAGKPVTIRTLDVGGEKLASALTSVIGESTNPALGLRAIRLGLREPKILDTQLAAILRVSAFCPARILVPMVSSAEQMRQVREHLDQVEKKLRRRGVKLPPEMPPVGAMIEIPGAALAADALTKVCDFFAIGSNDLTQYTLAIDRGDDRVASLYDPFHPAVLRLIQFTIAAAWRANIPVSLCGEMAGDPRATALLLGLGLREFSMSPTRFPLVKQRIRQLTLPAAINCAEAVMSKTDETSIRALIEAESEATPSKRSKD